MKLKKRFFILNTSVILVPIVITICVYFMLDYFSSLISTKYNDKYLTMIQFDEYDLLEVNLSPNLEGYFKLTAEKLSEKGIFIIAKKGDRFLVNSKNISNTDFEEGILKLNKEMVPYKILVLHNEKYMSKYISIITNNNEKIDIMLLIFYEKEIAKESNILLISLFVFIFTTILTIFVINKIASNQIIKPIEKLTIASNNIKEGNLDFEVIEDGDKEVRLLCNSFEQMRLKLKEAVMLKIKFDDNRKVLLSSISHDLKTPITTIKGYVEGIFDGIAGDREKVDKYLKIIYAKSIQMDNLIDDLFLYSKLDLEQIPFNLEIMNISEYFDDCVSEIQEDSKINNIELSYENKISNVTNVLIDSDKFKRVVYNIVENSKKFMKKNNGKLIIRLRDTKSSVIIELGDNGISLKEEELKMIFERFYRGDTARKTKGSGLGLSISKQIVDSHNGKIWAINNDIGGLSIIISLPKTNKLNGEK